MEMLGVLAIIGVLSIIGLWGYQIAIQMWKMAETYDQVGKTIISARTAMLANRYAENVDAEGLSTYIVDIREIMSGVQFNAGDARIEDESFTTPTNVAVWVRMENPTAFTVRINGINQDMCETFVGMQSGYKFAYKQDSTQGRDGQGSDLNEESPYELLIRDEDARIAFCEAFVMEGKDHRRPYVQEVAGLNWAVAERVDEYPTLVLWFEDDKASGKGSVKLCASDDDCDNCYVCDVDLKICRQGVCGVDELDADCCSVIVKECTENTTQNNSGVTTASCCMAVGMHWEKDVGASGESAGMVDGEYDATKDVLGTCCQQNSPYKSPETDLYGEHSEDKWFQIHSACCEGALGGTMIDGVNMCCKTSKAYDAKSRNFTKSTKECCEALGDAAFVSVDTDNADCCQKKSGKTAPYLHSGVGYTELVLSRACCLEAGGYVSEDGDVCCEDVAGSDKAWDNTANGFTKSDARCGGEPPCGEGETEYCAEEWGGKSDLLVRAFREVSGNVTLSGYEPKYFGGGSCKRKGCCPKGGKVIRDTNSFGGSGKRRVREICYFDPENSNVSDPYCAKWLPGFENQVCMVYSVCDVPLENHDNGSGGTRKVCPSCSGTVERPEVSETCDAPELPRISACLLNDCSQFEKEFSVYPAVDTSEIEKDEDGTVTGDVKDSAAMKTPPALVVVTLARKETEELLCCEREWFPGAQEYFLEQLVFYENEYQNGSENEIYKKAKADVDKFVAAYDAEGNTFSSAIFSELFKRLNAGASPTKELMRDYNICKCLESGQSWTKDERCCPPGEKGTSPCHACPQGSNPTIERCDFRRPLADDCCSARPTHCFGGCCGYGPNVCVQDAANGGRCCEYLCTGSKAATLGGSAETAACCTDDGAASKVKGCCEYHNGVWVSNPDGEDKNADGSCCVGATDQKKGEKTKECCEVACEAKYGGDTGGSGSSSNGIYGNGVECRWYDEAVPERGIMERGCYACAPGLQEEPED